MTTRTQPLPQDTSSFVYSILNFPIKLVTTPIEFVANKVKMCVKIFLGYLQNTAVFSFGMWSRSWVRRTLIDLQKGGCCDTARRTRFDPQRLIDARNVLKKMGASFFTCETKNGLDIDAAHISWKKTEQAIRDAGGKVCRKLQVNDLAIQHSKKGAAVSQYQATQVSGINPFAKGTFEVDVILEDDLPVKGWSQRHETWKKFCAEALSQIKFDEITIQTPQGIKKGYLINSYFSGAKRPAEGVLFIRCTSPTESWPMAKRDIMRRVLGCKADMITGDYPGTMNSEGVPSEGSYILFAEALVKEALKRGYPLSKIWAEGFCLGGSVATTTKGIFPEINLFLQNTFCCLHDTLNQQAWFAKYLAPWALEGVLSWDDEITKATNQTRFNNAALLRSVGKELEEKGLSKQGVTLIVNGTPDTTIHAHSRETLAEAAKTCSSEVETIEVSYCTKKQKCQPENHVCGVNAHSKDVLADVDTWRKVVAFLAKTHPEGKLGWLYEVLNRGKNLVSSVLSRSRVHRISTL